MSSNDQTTRDEESNVPIGTTQFPLDDFRATLADLFRTQAFVTTADLAAEVGCTRETARVKLNDLTDEGVLTAREVGASAKVWHPATMDQDVQAELWSATEQAGDHSGESGGSASEQDAPAPDQTGDERVMFFPSRREIVVDDPTDDTRATLSRGAHLVDSTGDGYLYKISEGDVWNAGYDAFDEYRDALKTLVGEANWSPSFESRIKDDWDRAHQFRLRTGDDGLTWLTATDEDAFYEAKRRLEYNDHYTRFDEDGLELRLKRGAEGAVKEHLYDEGYPPIDERRLEDGADLPLELREDIELRDYQQDWVDHFAARKAGVFVGPSGSGKTVAALGAMASISGETLILVPSRELASQWRDEIQSKLAIGDAGLLSNVDNIGLYHGGEKNIRPITIATYDTASMSRHRKLFNEREWGLVIADECHHAVADTWKRFRSIQSTARLGLSATPVRESGDAKEIYTLIGPPVGTDWGKLFADGWVSRPDVEVLMVPWASNAARERYQQADGSSKLIEAARNPAKVDVVQSFLDEHAGEKVLIFVDWIRQGTELAEALDLPFIYGETTHAQREDYYQAFRDGEQRALIVSRVGDEGIDLPDAEVAILASTMGSSRSQTGQRAGRTMRPMGDSQVYVLLTKGSGEEDWGRESTQYLAEKGIEITKTDWEDR